MITFPYNTGLYVQEKCKSIANAEELHLSCTNLSISSNVNDVSWFTWDTALEALKFQSAITANFCRWQWIARLSHNQIIIIEVLKCHIHIVSASPQFSRGWRRDGRGLKWGQVSNRSVAELQWCSRSPEVSQITGNSAVCSTVYLG